MPSSSLNPRVSALSPHALSIMRPLLRRIALWHRDRIAEVRGIDGASANVDEEDCDLDLATGVPPSLDAVLSPLHLRFDALFSATPAASGMTDGEIAEAIAEGFDPFAEEIETHRTSALPQPPMRALVMAARFAALLGSPDDVEAMTAQRAFSLITLASLEDLKALWREIERILGWLSDLDHHLESRWRGFETPVRGEAAADRKSDGAKREADFESAISNAVRTGSKVIALARDENALPPVGRAMCGRCLRLPPLARDICVEILRVTHSATGEVADEALREFLPDDAALAALPFAVVEGAFRERTTLAVAKALAVASARLRKSTGKSLEDVALNDAVRAPIARLVADVAAWRSGNLAWQEVSASILLCGPPGNGKTLLATALAGAMDVPLVATSYSDCQRHGHQGDMLRALSAKVEEAIWNAPCVFFIDELDSFTRRDAPSRRNDYIVGVVNGLLEHLARLNDTPGVVVLGATNYPEMIDPAVKRPGRFDLHLEIRDPDRAAILRILEKAIGKDAAQFDLSYIADQLLGSSGAHVTATVREARGLARSEHTALQERHLNAASSRIAPPIDQDLLWRMAIHEAGHLVVAHHLGLPAAKKAALTNAGGYVDIPERPLENRETAYHRIVTLMAGRAAEKVILGAPSNGAGQGPKSDLAEATRLAAKAEYAWGLGTRLVHIPPEFLFRHALSDEVTAEIDATLKRALKAAIGIIVDQNEALVRVATALINERELSETRIADFLNPDQTGATSKSLTAGLDVPF